MGSSFSPPFTAKNGVMFRVLVVVRVSDPGPGKQHIRSLEDQEAKITEWLTPRIDLPIEVKVIASSGSGEKLDRDEFLQLTEHAETGT